MDSGYQEKVISSPPNSPLKLPSRALLRIHIGLQASPLKLSSRALLTIHIGLQASLPVGGQGRPGPLGVLLGMGVSQGAVPVEQRKGEPEQNPKSETIFLSEPNSLQEPL